MHLNKNNKSTADKERKRVKNSLSLCWSGDPGGRQQTKVCAIICRSETTAHGNATGHDECQSIQKLVGRL